MRYLFIISFVFCAVLMNQQLVAMEVGETPSMNSKIQKLKKRAEKLHKELALLEQDLLFPASSQIAVYVSMETTLLDMDSIALRINGKRVTDYLYSDEQVTAFAEGGVQQLYLDNIASGFVDVDISIKGKQLKGKAGESIRYNSQVKQRFHKDNSGLAIELVIEATAQPAKITAKLTQR